MTECDICRDSIIDHDYIGKDCLRKHDEITTQLLEACKLVIKLWGKVPSPLTYNKVEAAIIAAAERCL